MKILTTYLQFELHKSLSGFIFFSFFQLSSQMTCMLLQSVDRFVPVAHKNLFLPLMFLITLFTLFVFVCLFLFFVCLFVFCLFAFSRAMEVPRLGVESEL